MPVVKGSQNDQFVASVKNHPYFVEKKFHVHKLVTNMRLNRDQQVYRDFCMAIGTGSNYDPPQSRSVNLPQNLVAQTEEDLIDFVYADRGALIAPLTNFEYLADRAIMAPTNEICDRINQTIHDRIPNQPHVLLSVNRVTSNVEVTDDLLSTTVANYHIEMIQLRKPNGFPDHRLELKVGDIVMLIRNLSLPARQCNGTRLQIINITPDLITCKHILGTLKGRVIHVTKARFIFTRKEGEEGVPFHRIQFPFKLAFGMTINKAQGQTIGCAGVLLNKTQCFAHGQAYVAFSRVRSADTIKVLPFNIKEPKITNVVCQEILDEDERPPLPQP